MQNRLQMLHENFTAIQPAKLCSPKHTSRRESHKHLTSIQFIAGAGRLPGKKLLLRT